jgi:hypothetical protein
MPTLTIEYRTDAERLVLEQAAAFLTQMRQIADTAPGGTVLDACERVALDAGRRLIRDALAQAVQARADAADAPKKCPGPATRGDTPAG